MLLTHFRPIPKSFQRCQHLVSPMMRDSEQMWVDGRFWRVGPVDLAACLWLPPFRPLQNLRIVSCR